MGTKEELHKEHSLLTVKKQELETKKASMPPKEGETWVLKLVDLEEHAKIEKEIEKIDNRIREIEKILRNFKF